MSIDDLKGLLRSRAGFEVVDGSSGENQIRLVGRVPPNASQHWVLIVQRLLVSSETAAWKADISKIYFVRGPQKKLYYAWRIILQAPRVAEHLPGIMEVVQNAPRPARVELQEFPLTGASATRNQIINGKGAGSVDKMPLGPMAAMQALADRSRR